MRLFGKSKKRILREFYRDKALQNIEDLTDYLDNTVIDSPDDLEAYRKAIDDYIFCLKLTIKLIK